MLPKSKITMGETQIYSRQERSDIDTISDQMELRYVRSKGMETLDIWMTSLGEPRLWIKV